MALPGVTSVIKDTFGPCGGTSQTKKKALLDADSESALKYYETKRQKETTETQVSSVSDQNKDFYIACPDMACKQFGKIKQAAKFQTANRFHNSDSSSYHGVWVPVQYVCECGKEPLTGRKWDLQWELEHLMADRRRKINELNTSLKLLGLKPVDYNDDDWRNENA